METKSKNKINNNNECIWQFDDSYDYPENYGFGEKIPEEYKKIADEFFEKINNRR